MSPTESLPATQVQRLYILTGEPSGDTHAAAVVREIKKLQQDIRFRGMGGDALSAEGVELVEHVRNTAIMGFVEVFKKLGFIRDLMARVQSDILEFQPDRILVVDYPGFNLRMATWARQQGFSVDMYIGPQVWAWKRRRIYRMARDLERLYVILPFETESYEEVSLEVEYVGHPLADSHGLEAAENDEPQWRAQLGIPADARILALLPGSRSQEIERMLPCLEATARSFPDLHAVVAGAPGREAGDYRTDLPVIFGETQNLYRYAEAGIITSGTATLEAALQGLPQVVAYRTSALTYALARWFTKVQFISLVNLVLGTEAVPERIQGDCNEKNLTRTLKEVLSPEGLRIQKESYARLREVLQGQDAAARVARGLLRLDR